MYMYAWFHVTSVIVCSSCGTHTQTVYTMYCCHYIISNLVIFRLSVDIHECHDTMIIDDHKVMYMYLGIG